MWDMIVSVPDHFTLQRKLMEKRTSYKSCYFSRVKITPLEICMSFRQYCLVFH